MSRKGNYPFKPDFVVPPGTTLKTLLSEMGMTQKELAERMGITVVSLSRIINGRQPITYATAEKLELALGHPSSFWITREGNFRKHLHRISMEKRYLEEESLFREFPVKELGERGVINTNQSIAEQIRQLLGFLRAASFKDWMNTRDAVNFKRTTTLKTTPQAVSVWLQLARNKANQIECDTFKLVEFKKSLREIRGLTNEDPAVFFPKMIELCAAAGVAFVVEPNIPKAPIFGATEWLSKDKAMIALSCRTKMEDSFWFSFFHEAGHVLNDKRNSNYIRYDDTSNPEINDIEEAANQFAADFLIPSNYDDSICCARTDAEFYSIAKELDISVGIVAGRYRYLSGFTKTRANLIGRITCEDVQTV